MMNMIGIFIFVGILTILFGEQGWRPNKNIYAISQFTYAYVLPVIAAFISGNQMRGKEEHRDSDEVHAGGVIAVMAEAGLLAGGCEAGIFGAMILGPCAGLLWKRVLEPAIKKANIDIEMLVRNLVVAGAGALFAVCSFYVAAPVLERVNACIMQGISIMIEQKAIFLLSLLLEPMKILFLNNSIHYGILVPLGIQQAAESGKSMLFLLETNPGPGFGVLLALFITKKQKRGQYASGMFVQLIGGIHEVYFAEVLSDIRLLAALIAGGMVGNLCFLLMDVEAVTAVSPGSLITFLLSCASTNVIGAAAGIALSALTSFAVSGFILCASAGRGTQTHGQSAQEPEKITVDEKCGEKKMIEKIGFVCDAGVGSSSMAAALMRRKLKELQIEDIEVAAYASDQVPQDLDLIICQRNFRELLLPQLADTRCYTMESLVNQQELSDIALKIQMGRNAGT